MDPALEQAMTEIRDDAVDPAVIEAAAARVWANLAAQLPQAPASARCADFQALIPEFKAGRLPEARALLVKDHLHECVACRRVYEGRVVSMPAPRRAAPRQLHRPLGRRRRRGRRRRAFRLVRRAISTATAPDAPSCRPSTARSTRSCPPESRCWPSGQDLPDGVEVRTAKDSDAMLQLRTAASWNSASAPASPPPQTASDLTIRLGRGSIIVQAAKRSSGHLYVATADCRVAVTGTVFSVTRREGLARVRGRRRSPRLAGQATRRSCTPAIRPSPAPTSSRSP